MPVIHLISTFMIASVGAGQAAPIEKIPLSKIKKEAVARVVTAMSTPLRSGHPVLFLLSGEPDADPIATRLQFPADQRYSKWSVVFDSAIRVETVEVETCEGSKPFADGVELFVDYNEKRLFSDGGKKTVQFKVKAPLRSMTLGFLESQGLCLSRLTLKTSDEWMRPRTVNATGHQVIADGALGVSSRTVGEGKKAKYLGVSKTERKAGEWSLAWENPLIVESLRVWNGNQHPGESFQEVDRVKDIEVRVDGGKPIRSTLEDRRYSQQVELGEPHAIRTLELKSVSSYPGTQATEPMLSEVQLSAGGENWIPVVPAVASSDTNFGESLQAAVVRERGYGDVLDRELRADDRGETWKFRIRSDGTFFARVFMDRARVAKAWSVVGTWRLLDKPEAKLENKTEPKTNVPLAASRSLIKTFARSQGASVAPTFANTPGLGLSLVGMKMATAEALDSLPCGTACFASAEERAPTTAREQPVLEQIELQREGRSLFLIRNRTDQEKRTLEFSDLKVRIHSLYD